MTTDYRDTLREIHTFPSLVKFLRDDLDWPIDSTGDFEDITFDYTPAELGIDASSAAKIEEIKQLRRLAGNQPWGIFFVKFEPKQLPVVALRSGRGHTRGVRAPTRFQPPALPLAPKLAVRARRPLLCDTLR